MPAVTPSFTLDAPNQAVIVTAGPYQFSVTLGEIAPYFSRPPSYARFLARLITAIDASGIAVTQANAASIVSYLNTNAASIPWQ